MRILYILIGLFLWICILPALFIGALLGYLAAGLGGGLLIALAVPVILFFLGAYLIYKGIKSR